MLSIVRKAGMKARGLGFVPSIAIGLFLAAWVTLAAGFEKIIFIETKGWQMVSSLCIPAFVVWITASILVYGMLVVVVFLWGTISGIWETWWGKLIIIAIIAIFILINFNTEVATFWSQIKPSLDPSAVREFKDTITYVLNFLIDKIYSR